MIDTIINWMGGYTNEQVAECIFAIELLPLAKLFYHTWKSINSKEDRHYHVDSIYGAAAWVLSICLLGYGALWEEGGLLWTGGVMVSVLAAWTATYIGCRMHTASSEVIADAKAILSTEEEDEESEKSEVAAQKECKVDEVIEPKNLDDIQKDFDEKSKK